MFFWIIVGTSESLVSAQGLIDLIPVVESYRIVVSKQIVFLTHYVEFRILSRCKELIDQGELLVAQPRSLRPLVVA